LEIKPQSSIMILKKDAAMENKLNKTGDTYKNFKLQRIVDLPEIQCTLRELEHVPSGASVMHIENEDPENVFCLSFQTTPESSNGVAHILEHTVLCGSEKFPVKDPFFAMTRRSLNTFMNAFTGADFTCYPAASQNPKDFYNLLEVYLDAVFKPHLKELSFLQEGHRLEFTQSSDPSSPLEFKGIVFNEMKGALSNPDSRLNEAINEALYPDLTYGINSGGDPKVIPTLTYQQLLDFHKKYYHPGRCLFYFYGNLPLSKHLDFIEEHALQGVEKTTKLPLIKAQPKHPEKIKKIIPYPYASEEEAEDKCIIAFAWLTCHVLDQKTLLALSILCTVLLSTDAAPVKKALLKSKMCKHVSAYLIDEYSEIPVYITLKGCLEENADKLEQVILDTLRSIVETKVPQDLIDNALHQIEFHRSEITGDSYPYGLNLFMRSGLLKQHGGKPEDALLIHSLCEEIRKTFQDNPNFYVDLIKKYFLDNTHFVCTIAKPDKDLEKKEAEEEQAALELLRRKMDSKQDQEMITQAKKLANFQEAQEHVDLDVLPKVTLADVPKKALDYKLETEEVGALNVFRHTCFTNKIVYADLVFPLPYIHERELPLLKLVTLLMPQMGCGKRSYSENLEYIQAHTGGVTATETLNVQVNDFNEFHPYLLIHGKALYRKAEELFTLLYEMATATDFTDRTRLKEVIVKHFTGLQNSLNQNALRYAMNLAASGLGTASRIGLSWNGLEYYHFIKDIVDHFDTRIEELVHQLEELKTRVLCLKNPHLVLTCDEKTYQDLKSKHFYGLSDIPVRAFKPWIADYKIEQVPPQGRVIASPVAFTAKIFKSLYYAHPDTPALCIAGNLFDNLVLHAKIREQGGAYGSGAMNNSLAGNFSFYAYRDPHIEASLDAFEESVKKISSGDFKDSDLEEAKLEIIQDLDSPISPGSRGHVAYTRLREGKTLEIRQAYRDAILKVNKEDIIQAIQKHLIPMQMHANTVVFAGKELLEKENKALSAKGKKILEIKKI